MLLIVFHRLKRYKYNLCIIRLGPFKAHVELHAGSTQYSNPKTKTSRESTTCLEGKDKKCKGVRINEIKITRFNLGSTHWLLGALNAKDDSKLYHSGGITISLQEKYVPWTKLTIYNSWTTLSVLNAEPAWNPTLLRGESDGLIIWLINFERSNTALWNIHRRKTVSCTNF